MKLLEWWWSLETLSFTETMKMLPQPSNPTISEFQKVTKDIQQPTALSKEKKCWHSVGSSAYGILTWPRASVLWSSVVAFKTSSLSLTVYTKYAIPEPQGKHTRFRTLQKAPTPALRLFDPPAPWESPIHKALALFDVRERLLSRKSPISRAFVKNNQLQLINITAIKFAIPTGQTRVRSKT